MRTLVIYQSNTGFTKQYALWIADDIQCEAIELKQVTEQKIKDVDVVIFGGWITAGMISGLAKLRREYKGRLIVFAVGGAPMETVDREYIIKRNQLGGLPFYYYQGGICFERLSFTQRKLLDLYKKSLERKRNKTEVDIGTIQGLSQSYNIADRKYIGQLVKEYQEYKERE